MIVFIITLALGLQFSNTEGAEILRGYLVASDGSMCINTVSGTSVTSSGSVTADANGYSTICTLLSLKDGANAGQYIIEKQDDATKQMTLADNAFTTFTASGTELLLSDSTTQITGITSADVSTVTNIMNPFSVNGLAEGIGSDDCLKHDGKYSIGGDCTGQYWVFVTAACTETSCSACNPDPAACSECPSDAALTSSNICLDCSGETGCLTCNLDSSDNIVCLTCGNTKFPTSNGACDFCGAIIPDCVACSVADGVTSCTDCTPKDLSADGKACVTCDVPDCDKCSGDSECEVCNGNKLPNKDQDGCFDCSGVANCETCESAGVCSACSGGMVLNDTGDACEATTTPSTTEANTSEATTTSDAGTNTVSGLAIVGIALLTLA